MALPSVAADVLKLKPGARLTLTDRLADGTRLPVLITGLYEAADQADPYWQLDELGGRGIRKVFFTTYGPLLTDPAVLDSERISSGEMSWLAVADFRTVTTDRIDALHTASTRGPKALLAAPEFKDGALAQTSLPTVLDQIDRALLVSRSTLMIVAVQLVLLAGYALLLVARLLSSERGGETELLRARGGSRGRITSLAAIEALLLALPAALIAPLLAGPLTRLLADRSELTRLGLRLDAGATGTVWLVAAAVALACALAVVAPALAANAGVRSRTRAAALPGPVRAGADIGLLLIAAVAYWQLDRQTGSSGSGALSGDREGDLGVDPLLVAAPALLLLAGTVLTLRLLPPAARLAERRAASGRGCPPRWPDGSSAAVRCAAPDRCCCWSWLPRWECWRSGRVRPGTVRRATRPTSGPARRCAWSAESTAIRRRPGRTRSCRGYGRRRPRSVRRWICPATARRTWSPWTPRTPTSGC